MTRARGAHEPRKRRFRSPLYRAVGRLARRIPHRWEERLLAVIAAVSMTIMARRRRMVARHLARVAGGPLSDAERRRAVRASFRSYARYWLDTFRLASSPRGQFDDRVDATEGLAILDAALAAGRGAVLVTPHLGSWDLGGAWLAGRGYPLVTVVERLRPRRLLEWLLEVRRRHGITVLVRGPGVRDQLAAALERNEVVVLVSDRDLGGRGVEVEFFGERTTLPPGPARLARQSGAPLIPVAIYHVGDGQHRGELRPAVPVQCTDDERADIAATTQRLAGELEALVRVAPEQWHLMVPNWPSDRIAHRTRRWAR
ncbi:MAG: phosphatidylinositol mannoside acyltransferase [Acidimicrobiia bacterium]|nr:phosphatidylinositol mannoside acyltransferase [Acidimicrobiia bacterium]